MNWIRALRALARVELRQLTRQRGRSALIVLLVAAPVAAIVAGSTLAGIAQVTPTERATARMGSADLRIDWDGRYATLERLRSLLPTSAKETRLFEGIETVRMSGRKLRARVLAVDAVSIESGGLAAGAVVIGPGRAPANAGEMALSPALLRDLGLAIGDSAALAFGSSRTITGIVQDPEALDGPLVLRTAAQVEYRGVHALLIGLGDGSAPATAERLRAAGFDVTTRQEELEARDPLATMVVFAVGCVALFEAGLVIAAAFAVGFRRRQHEIGLLGAAGAPTRDVALSMVLSAAALALIGGCLGAAAGLGAAWGAHGFLDTWLNRFVGGFEAPWSSIVGAVSLGVLAASLAAALPARRAARVPIREALSGRRPVAAPSGRWLAMGGASLAFGVGLALLAPRDHPVMAGLAVALGPILTIAGLGACSPWLLSALAHWAAPLPLAWRLAVRDAGRFRGRNGPVVTAVLAGMSMSVAAAVVVASIEAAIGAFPPEYRDDQLLVEGPGAEAAAERLRGALPCVAAAPLTAAYASGQPVRARVAGTERAAGRREWVACGGVELLRALGIEAAGQAFGEGRLIAVDAPAGARVELSRWLSGEAIANMAAWGVSGSQPVASPRFALNEAALASLGLEPGPPLNRSLAPWILRLDQPVTHAMLDRARAIAAETSGTSIDASILHTRPARGVYYGVLIVSVLTGLIIVAVATALTASESEGDSRVLYTVGASPGLMRTHAAARAGYLAILGCALAAPAGLITASAIFGIANFPLEFILPWRDLAIATLGLPALVFAGGWLFAGRRRIAGPVWRSAA
jgi:putative ABC transport system permease protein